ARVTVHDDLCGLHRAVRSEHLLQRLVGHTIGQIADVQLLAHLGLHRRKPGARPLHGNELATENTQLLGQEKEGKGEMPTTRPFANPGTHSLADAQTSKKTSTRGFSDCIPGRTAHVARLGPWEGR